MVALDFDGVLSPLAPTPSDARILPDAVLPVQGLAQLDGTTVAIISGRGRDDLARISGLDAPVHLVGSHGAERGGCPVQLTTHQARLREEIRAELATLSDGVSGAAIEMKPGGVVLHVRQVEDETADRLLDDVRSRMGARDDLVVRIGHRTADVAVIPMDKGTALGSLRGQFHPERVLFVGDDVTDEAAFDVLMAEDVGVKVGSGSTLAGYRLPSPSDVVAMLTELFEVRTNRFV